MGAEVPSKSVEKIIVGWAGIHAWAGERIGSGRHRERRHRSLALTQNGHGGRNRTVLRTVVAAAKHVHAGHHRRVRGHHSEHASRVLVAHLWYHLHAHVPIVRTSDGTRATTERHERQLRASGVVRDIAVRQLTASQTKVRIGTVVIHDVGIPIVVARLRRLVVGMR